MSLAMLVFNRVQRGRMDAVALSRVNKLARLFDADGRLALFGPQEAAHAGGLTRLWATPIAFRDACAMVNMYHRHHASPQGHLFSGGVFVGPRLVGAVIAGRPVSRHLDDGRTVELTRVVSDGTKNACSMAMGWAVREARRRGYTRVITYTLDSESGASLRGAGFRPIAQTRGGSWNVPSRRRGPDRHPTGLKVRWEHGRDGKVGADRAAGLLP